MIDNRFLLPVGAFMKERVSEAGGESAIMAHTQDPRFLFRQSAIMGTMMADWAARKRGKALGVGQAMIRDVAHAEPSGLPPDRGYSPRMIKSLERNHKKNLKVAKKAKPGKFKPHGTVVVLAPGRVSITDLKKIRKKQQAGECVVITISRSIATYTWSDVHVHSDHGDGHHYLKGLDLSDVPLYCSTRAHPGAARDYKWKSVSWFTHTRDEGLGAPLHFGCESVAGDALQLAYKQFKAERVILLGFEAPLENDGKHMRYWSGVTIQSMCYWYARAGVKVWNCSRPTTILAGVVIGTLAEAFRKQVFPLANFGPSGDHLFPKGVKNENQEISHSQPKAVRKTA